MIAQTIAQQIGRRALTMLGAHLLVDLGDGLQFRIDGSGKVNLVQVILDPCDTYTLRFWQVSSTRKELAPDLEVMMEDWAQVSTISDVYWDMLHDAISEHTGIQVEL